MKWGRITFANRAIERNFFNAGDTAQIFAVDIIYKEMQLHQDDIINIPIDEIRTYQGEKVILPIAGYFQYESRNPVFPASNDIIPIFLSLHCTAKQYLKHKKFWKNFEPIGCRDESTMQAMRKNGCDAYLLGCITSLFPRRDFIPETPHVFLVDVHPKAVHYVPEHIMQSAEYTTQDIPIDRNLPKQQIADIIQEKSKNIYSRYYNEATLIITSRLHVAVPCMAMGIPVIVVKDGFDKRFGWLEKFLPLYTPDQYDVINWDPQPVELEEHKKLLLHNAVSLLKRKACMHDLQYLHNFLMDRKRKELRTSFLVSGYQWLAQYSPQLAAFIRYKVLKPLSISARTDSQKK